LSSINLAIFITVRTGSTRLPKKALLDIYNGIPTIVFLIRRLKLSKLANIIVLCTTNLEEDNILCDLAEQEGILYFRGSVEDKLSRWHGATQKFNVDYFITADGDDLLCDPELIDLGFKQILEDKPDFIEAPHVAVGAFTYAISTKALTKVCEIKDSDNTEMMWVYFKDTGIFNVSLLKNVEELFLRPKIRLTLDYQDDLLFFKTVIKHFEEKNNPYFLRQILPYLDIHPEIVNINSYLMETFLENQKNKTKLLIKKEFMEKKIYE